MGAGRRNLVRKSCLCSLVPARRLLIEFLTKKAPCFTFDFEHSDALVEFGVVAVDLSFVDRTENEHIDRRDSSGQAGIDFPVQPGEDLGDDLLSTNQDLARLLVEALASEEFSPPEISDGGFDEHVLQLLGRCGHD